MSNIIVNENGCVTGSFTNDLDADVYYEIPSVYNDNGDIDIQETQKKIDEFVAMYSKLRIT